MSIVGIFASNSVDKIHPRIQMQIEMLEESGYEVRLFRTTTRRDSFFWEIRNWFALKYFKHGAIHRFRRNLAEVDCVHVYDLQLLPLLKYAKQQNKRTVYETLDDNVYLHFHALERIVPAFRIVKKAVTRRLARFELQYAKHYADHVLVNSPNLMEKFEKDQAIYLPYASPLEPSLMAMYDASKPVAFVYLGKLTASKGAAEYLELVQRFDKELFVFGKVFDQLAKTLVADPRVHEIGNFNALELRAELQQLAGQYNLIGLSIIHPENESYRLQEANKDIDYIALGIPIIGNDRLPTYQKIQHGAGCLYGDDAAINHLIRNEGNFYTNCQKSCEELAQNYTRSNFRRILSSVYQLISP